MSAEEEISFNKGNQESSMEEVVPMPSFDRCVVSQKVHLGRDTWTHCVYSEKGKGSRQEGV